MLRRNMLQSMQVLFDFFYIDELGRTDFIITRRVIYNIFV